MATKPTAPTKLNEDGFEPVLQEELPKPVAPIANPVASRAGAPIRDHIVKRATELGVDPELALSIIQQESGGNPNVRNSPKGAIGIAQVMPGTYRQMMGTDAGQNDPYNSIEAGLRYLRYGQSTLKTNDPALLAAGYHSGYNRRSLKSGQLPGPEVNDGAITSADYARSVSSRIAGGAAAAKTPMPVRQKVNADGFEPVDPAEFSKVDPDGFVPLSEEENKDIRENYTNRSWGRIAADTGRDLLASGLKIGPTALKGAADVANMLTGDTVDLGISKSMEGGMKAIDNVVGSKKFNAQQQQFANVMQDDDKGVGDMFAYLLDNPAVLVDQSITTVGSMLLPAGAAKGAVMATKAVGKAGLAGKAAAVATIGTSAAQNAADTFSSLEKQPLEDRYKGAAVSAGVSILMGIATGGGAEGMIAKKMAGELKAGKIGLASVKEFLKSVGKEAGQEVGEEVGNYTGEVVGGSGVEEKGINGPAKRIALAGTLGGTLGGVTHIGVHAGGQQPPATAKNQFQQAPATPIQPTPNAPSTAAGPLQRAAENASVKPDRVTATAPDGSKVTGTVTGTSQDGKVQIVDDNGEIVTFQTGPNGIKIEEEAPNTPLSNALEVAAGQQETAAAPAQDAPEVETAPVSQPEPETAPQPAPVQAAPIAEQPKPPALSEMDEPALRERLKYLADQAKTNGGWDKRLVVERRNVEKEINARAPKVEAAPAPEQPALDLQPVKVEAPKNAAPAPTAKPTEQTDAQKRSKSGYAEVKLNGKKHFVTPFDDNFVIRDGIGAMAKDGRTSLKFNSEADAIAYATANAKATRQPKGDTYGTETAQTVQAKAQGQEAPATAEPVTAASSASTQSAPLGATSQKALDRIARGTAYFGSKPKAEEWIAKSDLSASHEAVQGKAGRWDVRAKATVKESLTTQPEIKNANDAGSGSEWLRVGSGNRTLKNAQLDASSLNKKGDGYEYRVSKVENGDHAVERRKVENVNDNNPSGKPTSTEEVGQKADAVSTTAATVQPEAAKEKVATPADVSKNTPEVSTSAEPAQKSGKTEQVALDQKLAQLNEELERQGPVQNASTRAQRDSIRKQIAAEKFPDILNAVDENIDVAEELNDAFKYAGDEPKAKTIERVLKRRGITPEYQKRWTDRLLPDSTPPTGGGAPSPFAGNKIFTQSAVDKARARLKSKLTQFNQGIDPEMVMDGMTIAGAYIESGTRTFAAYSKAMVEDLGEAVKPYLLSFYEAARHYPGVDGDGMSSPKSAQAQHEAMMLDYAEVEKAKSTAKVGTLENDNEPAKLDQPSSRELEGKQPDAVQGSEPQREAGIGAEGRSTADARGNDGTGGQRAQQPGSVGNDAREVPVSTSRAAAGRGGKQGGEPVQRGKRAAKSDAVQRDAGNQPSLIPESGARAQDRADGFVITEDDAIGEGSAKTKFKQNVAAIRLLKELTAAGRQATRAEQAVLAKYVGWGGIPQAFYRDNNEVTKGWEKEAAELKEVMTEAELAAAAASTRNAHYTSPEVVGGLWDAVKHFGFQGGRTLEPSVGVGNFFGLMPTALRSASQLTGVELDHVTGGIAKQLYPNANIQAPVGFQDFTAPAGYFDLAIGNPPFGAEGIYDPRNRKISGFSIHNYFFAKSIDAVKPNGVLAMVVTNRLLDKVGDKERSHIAQRSEFLGAIRLPNNAFSKNAGTEVTTDIIFLRKLKDGEQPTGHKWTEVKQYKDANGKFVPLNEYFVANPDMMLGDFGMYGSMYSPEDSALVARTGQDTPTMLQEAIAKLPKGFMDAPTAAPALETIEPKGDISRVKVGSVFEQDGQIFERREDMLGKQQAAPVTFASDKAKERVSGMIKVRDALIEVRGLQLQENISEANLAAARGALNEEYDAFVKANGPLNADANKRLMRDDPTWPQIAALEDGFDKGISATVAKATGEKARAPSARKSAIFSKRTQAPYKAPESAKSAKDAMVSSLAERGRVDLDYMASLYAGHTPDQIAKELDGLIFKNPAGGWESRDQYLSGNVKKKLAQAIDAAKADPAMRANVDALKAVQPADIEAVDIDVKTGAHWVPADVMQEFIQTVSGGERAKAVYNPVSAAWTLSVERATAANVAEYATDRATLTNVLEAAANQKQIVIRDKQYDGSTILNEAATTAANAKVEKIKAEWKNWLWADDARRERLARIYNDTFNTDVQREFDGSHLTFPGKVGDDIIQLRPHQANAVWRMVQSGTTLLDHVVGAGKTFTMIAGIMEMRRMGLAKKPMLAVPNHLVGQWAEDFMKLYPGANILAATKKDFEKDNRKKLFARIATGDWDAVIVAHSSFGKVEVEPEFQEAFIKQQIADMDTSISAMRAAEGKSSRNVKQIEKQKANLEEKLKKLFDTGSKDDNLYFGELGVDAVLLDEAHEFKNLGFSTGMQRVAGLGNPAGSNKAADMFMKIQSTLARTGGKNVVFATGTPISNTMAEMYTMQRFLDYGTLKDQGIAHFDAWAKTLGEVVTDWELSPSGQYKMNSRFAKFVNMPELMQRYQSFADVVNRDDINRMLASQGKKLPVPKIKGGKPENTVVERSAAQAQYIGIPTVDENGVETYPEGSLIYRSENLPKKAQKGADNMLKIMSDARKAALDMRLIDPSYPDNPASKVNVAASNIKTIYDQWTADKGAQLVFIDLSTPKSAVAKEAAALRDLVAKAEEGDEAAQEKLDNMSPDELLALDSKFSVYDDLKAKLIAKGIPENEVAFIHDANTELQKEELFAKVRSGRVRVLFGSTAKMGAGMNVQERLVALHHLDAPWRPSDLEQREGRIIRQGNKLYDANPEGFEIQIKRYATKQTLDSRMWQTIEAKARFIEQVRKGTGAREVEDVAGEAANSAEMKAASSGNPLILEEMSLRQSIRKLENEKSEHDREQYRIKDRIRWANDYAAQSDKKAAQFEADAPLAPKEFAVKIGNQTFDKHGEAGQAILDAVNAMFDAGKDSREIGSYGGFKLTVDDASNAALEKRAVLTIEGNGSYQIEANPGSAPTGLALRLQNTVKTLATDAAQTKAAAERERAEVPKLQAKIKPWGSTKELAEAKTKHTAVIEQLKPKKKPDAKPEAANEDPAAFSRSGGKVAPVSRDPAKTPAYEALRQLSRFDESFIMGDSAAKGIEAIASDMQEQVVPELKFTTGKSTALSRGNRKPTLAIYAPGEGGNKILDIFDADTDRPYIVIGNSDVGTNVGAIRAYQIAFAWAHNNGKVMRPDPAGLTVINRLRRTMAMLSSAYRFGTTEHMEPHQDQYIALTEQAQKSKKEPEDTTSSNPAVNSQLGALKANMWKSGNDADTIATNVQNLITAAYQLAAIREPEIRRVQVVDGRVSLRGEVDTGVPLADDGADADTKKILGISLRPSVSGVGASTVKLLSVAASVQRSLNANVGKQLPVGGGDVENGSVGNSAVRAIQAIRQTIGDLSKSENSELAEVMYARGATGSDESVAQIQAAADAIAANWANKPEIVVVENLQDPKVPARVSEEDARQKSQGASGEPNGFYFGGKVYLVASQLKSGPEMASVLFHEALGHHGLRGLFGKELQPVLQSIVNLRRADVIAKAKSYGLDTSSPAQMLYAAEEVLAEMAQTNPNINFLKRAIAAIRSWLRANVPGFKDMALSDDEIIRDYILPARGWVERGAQAGAIGDVAFSRTPEAANEGLTPPEPGLLRKLQAAIQDNNNRVKAVQERISNVLGKDIPNYADYYMAITNMPGKVAARLEDFREKIGAPLVEGIAKSGHTLAQVEELAHAMHAIERNKAIAKINPKHDPESREFTGVEGSGMNTDKAMEIMSKYASDKAIQRHVEDLQKIAKATLDMKLAYGRITQDQYDAYTAAYDFYVPLKGDGEYGPDIKRAMGHDERAEHILENVMRDYEQSVATGERNIARQALLQMVLQNPDSKLWSVGVTPKGRYVAGQVYTIFKNGEEVAAFTSQSQVDAFMEAKGRESINYEVLDERGDRVREFARPLQDSEVPVYVDGQRVRIQIKDEILAGQLRPMDQGQMNWVLDKLSSLNRYLSKIYTGYSPTFLITNPLRDMQTGTVTMLGNYGAAMTAKAWSNYPSAMKALFQYAKNGTEPNTEMGRMLKEYRMNGGKTGASHMSDLEEQGKSISRLYDDAYGAKAFLADGKPTKAAIVAGRKTIMGMAHVFEVMNQATENGLRLALYVAQRNGGATVGEAAQAAKNVTVNFDRKGSETRTLAALFLFFNPAVQGTANAMRAIAKGDHKKQAWFALGTLAALGMWAVSAGLDDDEDRWLGEGWDTRSKKLVLNIGGTKITVPLSMEYAPFYATGVAIEEARRGVVKPMDSAGRIISSFIDAYVPFKGLYSYDSDNKPMDAMAAGMPTVLRPGFEAATNRNAFGSKIVPENDFTKDRPDNLKMNRNTKGSAYDSAAQGIAAAGEVLGAGRYENDITKVSPETLKHWWRTYTGGLGTFIGDSVGLSKLALDDPKAIEMADVPVVKAFAKGQDVSAIRGRFYEMSKEIRTTAEEFKQAKKAGDADAMDQILNTPSKAQLLGLERIVTKTTQAAAKLRDEEVTINADKSIPLIERRAAIKELQRQEEEMYRAAIEAFK